MNDVRHTLIVNATKQLQKEYEYICFQYKLKLTKPTIIIDKLANSFGKWDGNRNIIFISEDLIFKHVWHKVICVLKHEMAHQIVAQIFYSNDVHGSDFIKACHLLGLDPFYIKPSLSLIEDFPDWRPENVSKEEAKIFRKVEKLLNLAESSNEHEALLAMEKVRELYKKYNIERIINSSEMPCVSLTVDLKLKKIPSNTFIISNILQDHFFVSNVFSKMYVVAENSEHRCLVIMGEKHNVLMAEHVYEFLTHKIDSLWKMYQHKEHIAFRFKASYQKGLLEGFKSKLATSTYTPSTMTEKHEKSLMRRYEHQLSAYVKTQFPKTSGIQQSGLIYKNHYDKGTQEGRLITLSKPISERNSSSRTKLLLTGRINEQKY